ncbi:hypothetical protein [Nocardioides sp. L-11A]|uniref:hypothetical protein n=1 Tax=Nocardioides sp. L-11A TaxID=3043848 RepID=UPI00249C8C28|nr:hypothetical protein QJ852_00700 [Nocardioides sp. L-11A]
MTTTLTRPDHPAARSALASRRFWFGADAVVTGTNGLVYLAAAGALVDLLGGDAGTWRAVGAFLLVYAAGVALYARSPRSARAGWAIVVANTLWVVASLDVAVTGALDLDPVGRGWVVAQAVVVASFVLLQARVLRARLQA